MRDEMRSDEDTITEMGHLSFCGADSFQEQLGEGNVMKALGRGGSHATRPSAERKRKLRTRLEAEQRCPTKVTRLQSPPIPISIKFRAKSCCIPRVAVATSSRKKFKSGRAQDVNVKMRQVQGKGGPRGRAPGARLSG